MKLGTNIIVGFLMMTMFTGFILNIDIAQYWVYIGFNPMDFIFYRLLNLGISVSLLLAAVFLIGNFKIKLGILIFEFIYWLIILFFVKGEYSVGFGGTPSEKIVIHDFVATFLRLILIVHIYSNFRKIYFLLSVFMMLILTAGVILIKIEIFTHPIILIPLPID